jgi:hypothetical protein
MRLIKRIVSITLALSIFIVLLTSFPASTALADTAGPNNPATAIDSPAIGSVAWLDPGNVSQPGTPYATAVLDRSVVSHYLQGTGYGFSIPEEAIVVGIELTVNRQVVEHNAGLSDNSVRLLKGGSVVGTDKFNTTPWTTVFTAVTYGGSTDLWGTTWSPAEVNDPNFGAVFSVKRDNNGSSTRTAVVDSMQITVYYSYDATVNVECSNDSPVVYGDSVDCTATVTRLSGNQTPDGLVTWSSDGAGSFDPNPCTLEGSDDVASCTATYTPTAVGTGTHLVTANYDGGQYFVPGSDTEEVAVVERPITVTADPQTKVFGSPDPAFTYTYTPTLAFNDTFSGTLTRDPGEDVGQYAITQGSLELNDNYDLTYVGNYLDITPAAASCVVEPYDVTYDGDAHSATGSCKDLSGEDLTGLDLSGTVHTDAGVYTDTWTFSDTTGNYADQSDTVVDKIKQADAVCKVTPYDVPYDGEPHTATGSCTGLFEEELTGLDLTGTTHTDAGSYTDSWSFSNVNYNPQSDMVEDKITPVDALCSVEGWTGTYDGEPHGASGACLGVDDQPLEGLDLGESFTNVPGGTADWSFTDPDSNYNPASDSVDIVISKADPACTVTAYMVEYDKQAHTATGSCLGVMDENLAGLDLSGTTHTDVAIYLADPWTYTDATGNYNDKAGSVDDQITKRLVTITADPQTKHIGQPDPVLTYQVTSGSLLAGDTFSGTLTRQPGEKSGTYAILLGTLSLPDYYEVTYVGANLTIFGNATYLPMMHK